MAENVQWIRLKVGMFDGGSFKKIKRAKIGGVSYRDKLTAVWFELLDLAGKSNANGFLIDNNEIPYHTYEDIAIMLDREEKEIELCMQFFINEKMIEIIDDVYCLSNFVRYQNQEGLDKIREQKRIAQAKWRERKKMGLIEQDVDKKTSTQPSTDHLLSISNSIYISKSNNIDKDNNKKENILKENQTDIEKQTLSTNQADFLKALTNGSIISNQADTEKHNVSIEQTLPLDSAIKDIFDYWNTLDIVVHRKPTPNMVKAISKTLHNYSVEEIKSAMKNYNTVLKDNSYYFDYVWGIDTFLKQKNCLPHFVDSGEKWLSYCKKKEILNKTTKSTEVKQIQKGLFGI